MSSERNNVWKTGKWIAGGFQALGFLWLHNNGVCKDAGIRPYVMLNLVQHLTASLYLPPLLGEILKLVQDDVIVSIERWVVSIELWASSELMFFCQKKLTAHYSPLKMFFCQNTQNSPLTTHSSKLNAQNSKCLIFKLTGSALRIWGEVMVIFLVSPGNRSKKLSVKRAPW